MYGLLITVVSLECADFSSCGTSASSCSRALEHRLNNCGAHELPLGMWDLPRPGTEPMSPALAGGLFTAEPPGKPWYVFNSTELKAFGFMQAVACVSASFLFKAEKHPCVRTDHIISLLNR